MSSGASSINAARVELCADDDWDWRRSRNDGVSGRARNWSAGSRKLTLPFSARSSCTSTHAENMQTWSAQQNNGAHIVTFHGVRDAPVDNITINISM